MKYVKSILAIVGISLAAVWILATPWVCKYAASQRIIPGIGGELFWPFLPLLIWQVGKTLCDVFKSEEEEDEEESIHKGDSFIDLAGYAACADEIATEVTDHEQT